MSAAFTAGPWSWHKCFDHTGKRLISLDIVPRGGHSLSGVAVLASVFGNEADAHLIAAAPQLYDGCNALLGLLQLLLNRDDLPAEVREAMQTSHRVGEARAALALARGEQ